MFEMAQSQTILPNNSKAQIHSTGCDQRFNQLFLKTMLLQVYARTIKFDHSNEKINSYKKLRCLVQRLTKKYHFTWHLPVTWNIRMSFPVSKQISQSSTMWESVRFKNPATPAVKPINQSILLSPTYQLRL